MKPLHYTLADAHQWAAFSGDYNPVHFDLPWVQAQGGSQLSVHGMRALLDVKRYAGELFAAQNAPQSDYLKCVVRLRRPLWCDTDWLLVPDAPKKRLAATARVLCPDTREECLSCQISPQDWPDTPQGSQRTDISADMLLKLQQSFSVLAPGAALWQLLDALLFRQLIHDEALLRQENIAALLPQGAALQDVFSRYPVLQTHQELVFDSRLARRWQETMLPEALELQLLPSLVVGDIHNGALIRITAAARLNEQYLTNAITLKVGPVAH
ncbi:hypothetical protein [Entomohabitans teleogrylli]|uniref:hypothetical protein n=1 Tax=Entomohabitans teleogrylli TaxID=1384589 RepID=UPI00073D4D71|nr:hypothetical protein [Entomohabitans teleogrylli]